MPGGGSSKDTVQNKDPWAPAQPYLTDIMAKGGQLYNSGTGSQTWGGPLIAPQSTQTQMGINALTGVANSQAGTAGQPYAYGQNQIQNNGLTPGYAQPQGIYSGVAANAAQPTASATNLGGMASGADAGQNPYLMKMIQDNANVIGNRVNSAMSGAGRYGSAGHEDALARSISAANNPLLSSAYESDRNRMLQASGQIDASQNAANATRMGAASGLTGIQNFGQVNAAQWASMMPQLQQSAMAPGQALLGIGGLQDQYNQSNIDAQRQLFEQQQQMPWTQLAKYSGAVSGLSPLMQNAGTTTGQESTTKNLGLLDYASLFAGGPMGGSSAAAGGANAASALLGLLSDRNEKTDIKKLGRDPNTGLPLYSYRYRDDPKSYPKVVGPMAQDIEAAYPGSTIRIGGKLAVKREAVAAFGILALGKKAA